MTHKKIMEKCSKDLEKDAMHYKKEMKHAHGKKKKHEMIEEKEAEKSSKIMKKNAKKAHEY